MTGCIRAWYFMLWCLSYSVFIQLSLCSTCATTEIGRNERCMHKKEGGGGFYAIHTHIHLIITLNFECIQNHFMSNTGYTDKL